MAATGTRFVPQTDRRGILPAPDGDRKARTQMVNGVDLHVGQRLRRRRRLLGMTQSQLAEAVGVRFQQIQKYECGANRMTAGRLYELSRALDIGVQYFFDGLPSPDSVALRAGTGASHEMAAKRSA